MAYPYIPALYSLNAVPSYRPKSIVTEVYCMLLPPARFKVTPVEYQGGGGGVTVLNPEIKPDSVDSSPFYDSVYPLDPATLRITPSNTQAKPLYSTGNTYRSYNPYSLGRGSTRADMRFLRAYTTGTGWEFQFEIKGNKQRFDGIYPQRGIGVWIAEYIDFDYNQRICINNSQIARVFIKNKGGISVQQGPEGEDTVTITAATPDYFLAQDKIPKLPYLLRSAVERERALWSTMPRDETHLGFTPVGSGSFNGDPVAGFATYTDQFTASANELLSVKPANEAHILTENSIVHALKEAFDHHVFASRSPSGGAWTPIGNVFNINIRTDQSPENQIVSVEVGPGSPHDFCMEAIRHGNWDYWWDSLSNMNFMLNPCNGNWDGKQTVTVIAGGGVTGELRVAPPVIYPLVNRVAVEGQWSNTVEGGIAPLDNFTFNPGNKAVYPTGRAAGGEGSDVIFQGYMGIHTDLMAKSEFARLNETATVTLTNIPLASFAFTAFKNLIVWLVASDPLGGYDFSSGRYMSVENVEVEMQGLDGTGGGYPVTTFYLQEIRTS